MGNNYGVCISVTGKGSTDQIRQKPPWLRVRIPAGDLYAKLREKITARGLHTVCDEARCPNVAECWGKHGTATIMLMGRVCTRSCRFCAVTSGIPQPLDPGEPERVARAISDLGLKYVVLTSVCRDDLDDGGALHFTRTVQEIRNVCPGVRVEVLVPDFGGNTQSRPEKRYHSLRDGIT
jgi:lipoic acid synthetase